MLAKIVCRFGTAIAWVPFEENGKREFSHKVDDTFVQWSGQVIDTDFICEYSKNCARKHYQFKVELICTEIWLSALFRSMCTWLSWGFLFVVPKFLQRSLLLARLWSSHLKYFWNDSILKMFSNNSASDSCQPKSLIICWIFFTTRPP